VYTAGLNGQAIDVFVAANDDYRGTLIKRWVVLFRKGWIK
jgi:hypothetical protein